MHKFIKSTILTAISFIPLNLNAQLDVNNSSRLGNLSYLEHTTWITQPHLYDTTYPPSILTNLINLGTTLPKIENGLNVGERLTYINKSNRYKKLEGSFPQLAENNINISKKERKYWDLPLYKWAYRNIHFTLHSTRIDEKLVRDENFKWIPPVVKRQDLANNYKTVLNILNDYYKLNPNFSVLKYDPNITTEETIEGFSQGYFGATSSKYVRLIVKHNQSSDILALHFSLSRSSAGSNKYHSPHAFGYSHVTQQSRYGMTHVFNGPKIKEMAGKLDVIDNLLEHSKQNININININFKESGTKGTILIGDDEKEKPDYTKMYNDFGRFKLPK